MISHKIDNKHEDPSRCNTCKGFLNSFYLVDYAKKKIQCNLCSTEQALPPIMSCENHSTKEFGYTSFEILASSDYNSRKPQEPAYFFLIDVGVNSCNNNLLFYAISAIKTALESNAFNGQGYSSLGIALFDSNLHFIQFKNKSCRLVTMSSYNNVDSILPPVKLIGLFY